MAKPKDITGQRFGRLTAIENTGEKKNKNYLWLCRCDCGNEIITPTGYLSTGMTNSCGCLVMENFKDGTNVNFLSYEATKNNTSGVRGVSWDNFHQRWRATMSFKNEIVLQQSFMFKQDAINARKEAEEKYFKPILEKYGKTQ